MAAVLALLALLGPVVVHDSRETTPLTSVGSPRAPVVYERVSGPWRQWWLYFARNDQDRGIVRTGRHAGDWERSRSARTWPGGRSRRCTRSTRAPSAARGRRSSAAAGGR